MPIPNVISIEIDSCEQSLSVEMVLSERQIYERKKLHKRLLRKVGQAIADYEMLSGGDRVMVCVSGGKDSYSLLDILMTLRDRAPKPFEIIAFNLDQKQPGFPETVLPAYFSEKEIPFHIEEQDTYSVVKRVIPEGQTMCSLCSRLRRGVIYKVAKELGATKIALGHHRDDILETFFLNLFFGGTLKTMPPKLRSDDGMNCVIRPLAYVKEIDLIEYAKWRKFPIIPCQLCGNQLNSKRREVKQMLQSWGKQYNGRVEHIFAAMKKVVPSHLLDREVFDFSFGMHSTPLFSEKGSALFEEDFEEE